MSILFNCLFFVSLLFYARILAMEPSTCTVFDKADWEKGKSPFAFTYFKSCADHQVHLIDGAGVLPVIATTACNLDFLLPVAVVENGTDQHIGPEPVYVNPCNYPLHAGDTNVSSCLESSVAIAARAEELEMLGTSLSGESIKKMIEKTGKLLPNKGMLNGNYAVPTYLFLADSPPRLADILEEVKLRISTTPDAEYGKLFPTNSPLKRTNRIKMFALVNVLDVMNTLKAQGKYIVKPLAVSNYPYKLSPYLAQMIALNADIIQKALSEYQAVAQ